MRRFALAVPLALAGCVAAPRQAPLPPPPPPAPPVAAPAPAPLAQDWRDWPLTPGDWRYARGPTGPSAAYGPVGTPALTLSCDRTNRTMVLSFASTNPATITVRTSSTARALPLGTTAGGMAAATLPATDPLLDAMAFSRGRFTVEQAGAAPLVIPAWAEVGRVIEDCRR